MYITIRGSKKSPWLFGFKHQSTLMVCIYGTGIRTLNRAAMRCKRKFSDLDWIFLAIRQKIEIYPCYMMLCSIRMSYFTPYAYSHLYLLHFPLYKIYKRI